MKISLRVKIILAATVVLIGAGIIVQQRRQIAELRATAESQPVKAPAPVPKVEPPVAEVKPPAPPVVSRPAAAAPDMFTKLREMTKDPAFKDMVRAQQKMGLEMTYGALFKKLELTGEDLTDFKTLLGDRQMALMEAGMAMMGSPAASGDREQRRQAVVDLKATADKKIADFLGAEGYAVFKEYEDTQGERTQVNLFKHSLSSADALTEQQELDLIAAMNQERKNLPIPIPTPHSVPDPAQFTPEKIAELSAQLEQLQTRYLDRAAGILTPQQLQQFKTSQESMRAMQTMGMKMATQFLGQKNSPAPSP